MLYLKMVHLKTCAALTTSNAPGGFQLSAVLHTYVNQ